MGRKGAKLTLTTAEAAEQLLQDLSALGPVVSRKMFGGFGLFESGVMFAMVTSDGEVFFKVSDANRERFEVAGSVQFGRMPYFSLPQFVRDDADRLQEWAQTSIQAARHQKAAKSSSRQKSKRPRGAKKTNPPVS